MFVNKSIPCCKGNAQTAASNDDNLQSATVTVSDSSTVTIRQLSNNPTLSVNEQPIKHRENTQDDFDLQSQVSRVNGKNIVQQGVIDPRANLRLVSYQDDLQINML